VVNQGAVADRLLTRVCELVDKNHIQAQEIIETNRAFSDCTVDAQVSWQFEARSSVRTVAGIAAVEHHHHGYDKNSFDETVNRRCHDARHSRELRTSFMQRVAVAEEASLVWSGTKQIAHRFGDFSVCRHCRPCSGSGQVDCGGCSGTGRRTCGGCGGAGSQNKAHTVNRWDGRQNVSHTEYRRETCSSCFGAGRVVCSPCGGSGRERCGACAGHGKFTDIVTIDCVADPTWDVAVTATIAASPLRKYLQASGPEWCAGNLEFSCSMKGYSDDDAWLVGYKAITLVTQVDFEMKAAEYAVTAFGTGPHPFIRPPVFDQLLDSEIQELRSLRTKSGATRVKTALARHLFSGYCNVPVLDRSMQAMANLRGGTPDEIRRSLVKVCAGFISDTAAQELSDGLQAVLHKVSPPYSMGAWAAATILPIVAVTFYAEHLLELSFGWFDTAIVAATMLGLSAITVLVSSPLAWCFSASISALKRRRVPVSYRQKGRNWAPKKYFYMLALVAVTVGSLYGIATREIGLPSLSAPYEGTQSLVHEGLQALNVAGYAGLAKPDPLASSQLSTSTMTDRDVLREIQKKLNEKGYFVGVADGKMGRQTKMQIDSYLRNNGLSKNTSPATLLERLKK